MKSMKLSKTEKQINEVAMDSRPEYPYGLSISLDNDSLDKLDLKSLPGVGTEMVLEAKVKVTSASVSEYEGDGERKNMSLQITDMELKSTKKTKSAEDVLYAEGSIGGE